MVNLWYMHGQNTKGDKYKFSHDLTAVRKCDASSEELEKYTIDNQDEKKPDAVSKKHNKAEKKNSKTECANTFLNYQKQ